MITKFVSLTGDYAICRWIDDNYGKVEIIAIVHPDSLASYKIFYREITQLTTNEEQ